jgi:hypothetical protein
MAEQEEIWPELGRPRERSSLLSLSSLPIDSLVYSPLFPLSLAANFPPRPTNFSFPSRHRIEEGSDFHV